jgi:hypothetical protein
VTPDDIWAATGGSAHLVSLGCHILPDAGTRAIELNNIPGVPASTVLTVFHEVYARALL